MIQSNLDLAYAFPMSLREAALQMASALPEPIWNTDVFSVRVGGENLSIPYRIYHDPALIDTARLTAQQTELLDCLLTRHCSGFVREKHLVRILLLNHDWIPPFVVQLVGEYVIEILRVIQRDIRNLDAHLYRRFITENPAFFANTKQRVTSYWNCYYRWERREDYAGFQIVRYFDDLVGKNE
jgi:hypothetical protein